MSTGERNTLSREAKMQSEMLSRLTVWFRIAMAASTVGVVLAYWGLSGHSWRMAAGAAGILITILCAAAAAVINLGIRNGRKNVEKILTVLER